VIAVGPSLTHALDEQFPGAYVSWFITELTSHARG